MEDLYIKSFTLNNSLAAISAYMQSSAVLATDGIGSTVYSISDCSIEAIPTQRAYRRLRVSDSGTMTALGCCADTRLYFISECFEETGYVSLDSSIRSCGSLGVLTDASLTTVGDEPFIVGAFESGAYLFDMHGKRLTRLCSAERDETITDFISVGNELFALGTSKNGLTAITVVDGGKEYSGIVSKSVSLRMIFSVGRDIYALFGQSYIYNRIARIYSDGSFTLPDFTNNPSCRA